jgi:hypothetical protein
MTAGGTIGGCESRVYSGAYAFFERKVWESIKKTGARRGCEEENLMGLVVKGETSQTGVTKGLVIMGQGGRRGKRSSTGRVLGSL